MYRILNICIDSMKKSPEWYQSKFQSKKELKMVQTRKLNFLSSQ